MLSASAGLIAHLAQPAQTTAWLWLIERRDGAVFGFTSHDADISFGSVNYVASYGINPSAVQAGGGLSVSNAEVVTVFGGASVTEDDLQSGVWDHADVRVRLINWADTSLGVVKRLRGWLGEVTHDGFSFTAELRGLADLLGRSVGRVVSPDCSHELGDSACMVALGPFTATGTVGAVTSNRLFATDLSTPTIYAGGKLTWTSGANVGRSMEIQTADDDANVTLQLPMWLDVQTGDTFEAIRGCDHSFSTCRDVYDNGLRFGGMPDVPGPDRAVRGMGQ